MAIALVSNVAAQSSTTNTITTGAIDTSGATLLVALVNHYTGGGGGAILSDSKGNTWVGLTAQSVPTVSTSVRLYYAANPTVGTGHTFTATGTFSFPFVAAQAFSGALTVSPFDQQNGNTSSGATNLTTGSVTPSENDELLIAGLGFQDAIGTATPTIDLSFTRTNSLDRIVEGLGGAIAYLVQTTAAAANPTWSWVTSRPACTVIATFKAAASDILYPQSIF